MHPGPQAMRATEAIRRLIERLVVTDTPEEDLSALADVLDGAHKLLERAPARPRWYERQDAFSFLGYLDWSPFAGRLHPLAPPIELDRFGDRMRGTIVFNHSYEGPPGCVHGGYIAAAFDEVLGAAQAVTGSPGFTGTLSVRYRKPTPLDVELVCEGHVDRVEGRKIYTVGTLHAGDRLTAEAEAIFISQKDVRFLPGGR